LFLNVDCFCQVALHVYDSLITYGKNYGLRSAGYYALRSLRTEKFFAYWGTDLTPQDTPLECGRDFRVKYDVSYFFITTLDVHSIQSFHSVYSKYVSLLYITQFAVFCLFPLE